MTFPGFAEAMPWVIARVSVPRCRPAGHQASVRLRASGQAVRVRLAVFWSVFAFMGEILGSLSSGGGALGVFERPRRRAGDAIGEADARGPEFPVGAIIEARDPVSVHHLVAEAIVE